MLNISGNPRRISPSQLVYSMHTQLFGTRGELVITKRLHNKPQHCTMGRSLRHGWQNWTIYAVKRRYNSPRFLCSYSLTKDYCDRKNYLQPWWVHQCYTIAFQYRDWKIIERNFLPVDAWFSFQPQNEYVEQSRKRRGYRLDHFEKK